MRLPAPQEFPDSAEDESSYPDRDCPTSISCWATMPRERPRSSRAIAILPSARLHGISKLPDPQAHSFAQARRSTGRTGAVIPAILLANFSMHDQDRVGSPERRGDAETRTHWANSKPWTIPVSPLRGLGTDRVRIRRMMHSSCVGLRCVPSCRVDWTIPTRERTIQEPSSRGASGCRVSSRKHYPLNPLGNWLPEAQGEPSGTLHSRLISSFTSAGAGPRTGSPEKRQGRRVSVRARRDARSHFQRFLTGIEAFIGWVGDLLYHMYASAASQGRSSSRSRGDRDGR